MAVVVDPIQSVKGKVVIDAFRTINPQSLMLGQEPRQTTSNVGHLNKPSIQVLCVKAVVTSTHVIVFCVYQALIHGLNRHYYSISIDYRKNELEEQMLMNLHKQQWTDGLKLKSFEQHSTSNTEIMQVGFGLSMFCYAIIV